MDARSVKEVIGSTIIAATLIGGILWGYRWGSKREAAIFRKWVEENRFDVLLCQSRVIFGTGPFPYWKNPKQPVYFIRVRDQYGKERSGWVRFGSYWGGTWDSNKAEVRWRKEHEEIT